MVAKMFGVKDLEKLLLQALNKKQSEADDKFVLGAFFGLKTMCKIIKNKRRKHALINLLKRFPNRVNF